jgi:hypothetical protein
MLQQGTTVMSEMYHETLKNYVRFEVFTVVTLKDAVLWDVTPRGPYKNRRFGGI